MLDNNLPDISPFHAGELYIWVPRVKHPLVLRLHEPIQTLRSTSAQADRLRCQVHARRETGTKTEKYVSVDARKRNAPRPRDGER